MLLGCDKRPRLSPYSFKRGRLKQLIEEIRLFLIIRYYFYNYAEEKDIFMYINYVNADHVHALVDLPVHYGLKDAAKLFKGSSSFWINQNQLTVHKFNWARGYGAFSVSASGLGQVKSYIRNQEEHHRKKPFTEEYEAFLSAYKAGESQNR